MSNNTNKAASLTKMDHFSGSTVTTAYDPAEIQAGVPISLVHPEKMTVKALDGSTTEVKPEDAFGQIIATTPEAAGALRKAFRENTFNLYVDKNSSVEFGSKHVPTGTVMNGSHLNVVKGASVQDIQMDKSDITWDKGVIRDTSFTNSTNGKDDLAVGGGFLTGSTIRNSQIGMSDNRLSKVTLDGVIAGDITGHDSTIAAAAPTKTASHMPTIANTSFVNSQIKTGLDSTIMDSSFTNTTIQTDLANNFDNAKIKQAVLTDLNKDVKAKTGHTVSKSELSDLIATAPVTAADSTISGKPWHPVVVDNQFDATNTVLNTSNGAVVANADHKPVVLGKASGKTVELTDDDLAHNVEGVVPNRKGAMFKQLGAMDHGRYGIDKAGTFTINEKQVQGVVAEAQKGQNLAIEQEKSKAAAMKYMAEARAAANKALEDDGPEI